MKINVAVMAVPLTAIFLPLPTSAQLEPEMSNFATQQNCEERLAAAINIRSVWQSRLAARLAELEAVPPSAREYVPLLVANYEQQGATINETISILIEMCAAYSE